jgi:hypothetical protein
MMGQAANPGHVRSAPLATIVPKKGGPSMGQNGIVLSFRDIVRGRGCRSARQMLYGPTWSSPIIHWLRFFKSS